METLESFSSRKWSWGYLLLWESGYLKWDNNVISESNMELHDTAIRAIYKYLIRFNKALTEGKMHMIPRASSNTCCRMLSVEEKSYDYNLNSTGVVLTIRSFTSCHAMSPRTKHKFLICHAILSNSLARRNCLATKEVWHLGQLVYGEF